MALDSLSGSSPSGYLLTKGTGEGEEKIGISETCSMELQIRGTAHCASSNFHGPNGRDSLKTNLFSAERLGVYRERG